MSQSYIYEHFHWNTLFFFFFLQTQFIFFITVTRNVIFGQKMSGRLYLNVNCKSRMLYCLSGDDLFILCHYRGTSLTKKEKDEIVAKEAAAAATALVLKKEEARKIAEENGDVEGDVEGEKEEEDKNKDVVLKPTGPPLQFHRYSCGDLLCELYPAIAACCPDGTTYNVRKERQTNSKRLFVMSTPEQRKKYIIYYFILFFSSFISLLFT